MNRYRLIFDDGHDEFVDAASPADAVAAREGGRQARLPHTMTDLTAMRHWLDRPRTVPAGRVTINEDAPLRKWRAKEFTQ